MSPQQNLNNKFLHDTYDRIRKTSYDAVDTVARLRLYITVSGYSGSLRELIIAGGFTGADYDRLLALYNKQLSNQP